MGKNRENNIRRQSSIQVDQITILSQRLIKTI